MKFKCRECGKAEDSEKWCKSARERLDELRLCFNCDHWQQLVDVADSKKVVRVDGKHYMIEKDVSSGFKGYGGRGFTVQFNDGRLVTTHNLWHQGTVPEHFRDRLPDNACFGK